MSMSDTDSRSSRERPGAWSPTGSGASVFADSMLQPDRAGLFDGARVFDVCHVGLVLRAVLGVQAALALGVALAARSLDQWMWTLAGASAVSMVGVLSWLLLVCATRHWLSRRSEALQWALLGGLGALCAALGAQLQSLASQEPVGLFRGVAVALAGAVAAAVISAWLRGRAQARQPAAAQAQLVELQSRIRPHFLFNTLNTAIALVRIDPSRAESVLEDLSELFRVALEGAEAVASLDEEVALAQRYLAIEQIRFGERLRVRWELDAEAGGAKLPPLLLQPLVENAVRHGVEPNDAGGDVEVRTRRLGHDQVEIRISNSLGQGPRVPGHRMALRNVRQRLRLMHDVAARFELSVSASRFVVTITLPL